MTGFWHGASWNFVLWGVYFGVLLVLEKLFLLKLLQKLPTVLRHIYALLLITLSWTLFAFTDISAGFAWLGSMFSGVLFDSDSVYLLLTYGPMLLLCAFAATPIGKRIYDWLNGHLKQGCLPLPIVAGCCACLPQRRRIL